MPQKVISLRLFYLVQKPNWANLYLSEKSLTFAIEFQGDWTSGNTFHMDMPSFPKDVQVEEIVKCFCQAYRVGPTAHLRTYIHKVQTLDSLLEVRTFTSGSMIPGTSELRLRLTDSLLVRAIRCWEQTMNELWPASRQVEIIQQKTAP